MTRYLVAGILLSVLAANVSAQQQQKRFLTAPLTIEDQGSFFIGGVPKITDYSTPPPVASPIPRARPRLRPDRSRTRSRSVRCTCSSRFPPEGRRAGRSSWCTARAIRAPVSSRRRTAARAGIRISCGTAWPATSSTRPGAGVRGSTSRSSTKARRGSPAGDAAAAANLIPGFSRITDNSAWTNWFGHLVPEKSTILTGRLVPHGDAADPNPRPDKFDHVAPLFPIDAIDENLVSRQGAIGPAPASPDRTYALEYYKQLVPNAEVTLPGSICKTCDPMETGAVQHLDAAESGGAGRAARRRDRGHPFPVGDHGAPYGAHSEGTGPSRAAEGVDYDRRIVLASEQRPHRRGLRPHSLHGPQRRLRQCQHGLPGYRRRDQRPARGRSRDRRRRTT